DPRSGAVPANPGIRRTAPGLALHEVSNDLSDERLEDPRGRNADRKLPRAGRPEGVDRRVRRTPGQVRGGLHSHELQGSSGTMVQDTLTASVRHDLRDGTGLVKAMVLAAGLGERLPPLTTDRAKSSL